jgi:hypothetical protein
MQHTVMVVLLLVLLVVDLSMRQVPPCVIVSWPV